MKTTLKKLTPMMMGVLLMTSSCGQTSSQTSSGDKHTCTASCAPGCVGEKEHSCTAACGSDCKHKKSDVKSQKSKSMETVKKLDKDNVDELLGMVPQNWLHLEPKEQKTALKVYELLAKGKPVAREQLATSVNLPLKEVNEIVDNWPGVFFDDDKNIIGFWGLGIGKFSPYDFTVDGTTTHTWCAWDAVFIPPLLGKKAHVTSECPVTKEKIELTVHEDGRVESKKPGVMVSFIDPDQAGMMENVVVNFCHYIYFFSSKEAGEKWVSEHEGTYLLSLEDTRFLSSRKNEVQYKDIISVTK